MSSVFLSQFAFSTITYISPNSTFSSRVAKPKKARFNFISQLERSNHFSAFNFCPVKKVAIYVFVECM